MQMNTTVKPTAKGAPCKDCEKREPHCHSKCEGYISYKKEREKYLYHMREERLRENLKYGLKTKRVEY